jgi:hypothetical protein
MKTFGNPTTQELITLQTDENGTAIFERPRDAAEDWQPPAIVPLVKVPLPVVGTTQKAEPHLVWFSDRVERQWLIADLSPEEIAQKQQKIWPNVQQFMAEFSMSEKAAMALSTDPTIAALRLELSAWLSSVHANDSRVVLGVNKLVELNILTEQRKTEILDLNS